MSLLAFFWLYTRLRSHEFLDYLDTRGFWDKEDFIRTYDVALDRNCVTTLELNLLPSDVGVRNARLVEMVYCSEWASFVDALWDVINNGVVNRVDEFQAAAANLYGAGVLLSRMRWSF